MNIGSVCNRDVIVAWPDCSIQEAVKMMREYNVGDLIIAKSRNTECIPIGILTDRDIVVEVLAEDVPLEAVDIKDIMSSNLMTANENEELFNVIKLMRKKGIRRVPVINDQGVLVGIFAMENMLEIIAESMRDLVTLVHNENTHEHNMRH